MNNYDQDKKVTGNILKCIACFSMLIDHVDVVFLGNDYSLRCIGRMAFPLYIFLLVEGYLHTHNIRKYLTRLFAFTIISEIPYDLVFSHKLFAFSSNSVMWTLTLGFLCLCMVDNFWNGLYSASTAKSYDIIDGIVVIASLFIAEIFNVSYGATGILTIILCYVLKRANVDNRIVFIAINLLLVTFEAIEIWGLLALPAIMLYNGELGKKSKPLQLAFYLFYPVHLLIIFVVSAFLC